MTGHGVLRLDVPEQHDRLERLFGEATCFVMPSHSEASAIAYVEAAAAGLPSIGTSAGGSDYLIGDGGLIVDPGDDDALSTRCAGSPIPTAAEQMGAAASSAAASCSRGPRSPAGSCARSRARRPSRSPPTSRRRRRSRAARLAGRVSPGRAGCGPCA